MLTKDDILKEIKASSVFKLFHGKGEKIIDDSPIEQEVNKTGEAITRFHTLQRHLKRASRGTAKMPNELERVAQTIWTLIDRSIMAILSEDGVITSKDFKRFHDPLASIVEGYLTAVQRGDVAKLESIRRIQKLGGSKAFAKQLKKILKEDEVNPFTLMKVLYSLGTHLNIGFEKEPKIFQEGGLLEDVHWIIGRVQHKIRKGQTNMKEEVRVVQSWRLV